MGVAKMREGTGREWPENVAELDAGLHWAIESIADRELRHFCHEIFEPGGLRADFLTAPASAENHHAFPGGLAMHSLESFGLFNQFAQIGRPLPAEDCDIGRIACLLHDIGKALPQSTVSGRHAHEHAAREFLAPHLKNLAVQRKRAALLIEHCIGGHREQGSSSRLLYAVRQADITSACMNNEAIALSEGKRDGAFITLRTNGPQRRYYSPTDQLDGIE